VASNSACWSNSMPKLCSPLSINYDFVCFPQMLLCLKTLHVTWHSLTYSTYLLDRSGINAVEQRQVGKLHESSEPCRVESSFYTLNGFNSERTTLFQFSFSFGILKCLELDARMMCCTLFIPMLGSGKEWTRILWVQVGLLLPTSPTLNTSPPSTALTNVEFQENRSD
jgi:hypothetical protein